MAVNCNHEQILDKFKKKVAYLKGKEKQHHHQLHVALTNARKLGKQFKSTLKGKLHRLDTKIDAAQAAKYIKTFVQLERQMLKDVAKKAKAFAKALSQIDKEQAVKQKSSSKSRKSAVKRKK